MEHTPVIAVEEKWKIPTYPSPEPQEMPIYAEKRQHQGTTGNPYPVRIVPEVERSSREEREYTVIRLENDFIRVVVLPERGGRVFEAYDKKTDYHFVYRQHVIKPALVAAYGSWLAGGIEFNWPFHHRPSTFMPVDYELEREPDGTAIVWLSEHDPADRTKGTVGIALRPDVSWFETRVRVTNRTPLEHQFLWWESAGFHANKEYEIVFPPDVAWVHHHYDRSHTTFPIAYGQYGSERFDVPTDISQHKNIKTPNSIFAAPSRFEFFGGYDHGKDCGILHIANHHVSPGKKMFTWGYGSISENWHLAFTDSDGLHSELMAGTYSDDEPDFTWLAPFETKTWSQYWYPTHLLKGATYADLGGAISVDRKGKDSKIRLIVTSDVTGGKLTVNCGGKTVLEKPIDLSPSECVEFGLHLTEAKYHVIFCGPDGKTILEYTEYSPDPVHVPKDNPGLPAPSKLKTAQELFLTGLHIDQYRDPLLKPDLYYKAALEKDPDFLPALIGMGEYCYRTAKYDEALAYLQKGRKVENTYNTNPRSGTLGYLLGLVLFALGKQDEAYDAFYKAAWSADSIAKAMTFVSAIDGRRGDFEKMRSHAFEAIAKESRHPIARVYAALAAWKLGDDKTARKELQELASYDHLNHLERWATVLVSGTGEAGFFVPLHSNPSQTCLDVTFDLLRAGFLAETVHLFESLQKHGDASAMALYTLADCYEQLGDAKKAASTRTLASAKRIVDVFPYRLEEAAILEAALRVKPADATASYLLGCELYDKRHYERAASLWEDAIRHAPDFYIPYRCLAVACYSHLGRQNEALPLLLKANELHPHDEQLLTETSYVMAHTGVPAAEQAEFLSARRPAVIHDHLALALENTFNAAGEYDKAMELLTTHSFTACEGGEYNVAEPYMFNRLTLGRLALAEGETEKAMGYFENILKVPENLHVGFWNDSVLVPFEYHYAEALMKAGRKAEAEEKLHHISTLNNKGMWNMGGEFDYYSAMAARLAGNEAQGRAIMRSAVLSWEAQLADDDPGGSGSTPFYLSFVEDSRTVKRAALCFMLGYGKLFFGDTEGARQLFTESLRLDPSNMKCALELKLLK